MTDPISIPSAVTPRVRDQDERKLLWLILLRVAIITVLLGSTIAVNFSGGEIALPAYLYTLVAVVYLFSLLYIGLLLRKVRYLTQACAQIGGDVLAYSALVYLTGGIESAFPFIYSMAIINAAILLYRRGALITAAICTGAFALIAALETANILPVAEPGSLISPSPSSLSAFNTVFTNGAAFFFVGLLSSFLAEQLRKAESELAEAKGGLADLRLLSESILRSIGDGLCTVSTDGVVTYANQAAEEILGIETNSLVGRKLESIFPALASPGQGASRYREIPFRRAEDKPIYLGLSTSELRDKSGLIRGVLIVFHDLTPLKEMGQRVQHAERLAAIGQLAADMAHEIRNPLTSMSGCVELLSQDRDLPSDKRELMEIVLKETDRLNRLITDFLEYASPAPPHAAPLDLREVIRDTVSMLEHEHRDQEAPIEIELKVSGEVPIEADLNQLKQVLWNLLKNAIDAMPSGGRLTVSAATTPSGGALLTVSDTGVGIDPEAVKRIFDPFYTTKERGLGLGLATVYRIIQAHGGTIEVKSKTGDGATFVVHLPAAPNPDLASDAHAA